MKDRGFLDWAYVFLVVMFSAFVWWKLWIEPRDIFLNSVMDCMNEFEDSSRETYNFCASEVKNEDR